MTLIDRVRHYLSHQPATTSGRSDELPTIVPHKEVAEVERRLNLRLPTVLTDLYCRIGNGGYGPGHGLLSLTPRSKYDVTVVDWFERLCDSPKRTWPTEMIPICDWGCMILSCIDLSTGFDDPSVWRFEPNMEDADTRRMLDGGTYRGLGLIRESPRFSSWINDWIDGVEMFDRPYERSYE